MGRLFGGASAASAGRRGGRPAAGAACLDGKWARRRDEMIVFKRGLLAAALQADPRRLIKSSTGVWWPAEFS